MNLEKTIQELEAADKKISLAVAERNQLLRAIGADLRQLRKDRRLKGVTVAKALRVSQSHICFIESGTAKITVQLLKRIHTVLSKLNPPKTRWDKVDWSKSTSQIAKELNVSFQAVSKARKNFDR